MEKAISKEQQRYYKGTMKILLQYINDHPNEWSKWIYINAKPMVTALSYDNRKNLQLLKQLEFEGLVEKTKNAINNYTWLITDAVREFLGKDTINV